jgi:NAD(P)H-flavin reductase/hemoglobin-like flavoprotein
MALDPKLIRESFALVAGDAEKVSSHFYALLFTEHPELRDMFPPMMDGQRRRLFSALIRVVHDLDNPPQLMEYLQQLGRDHRKFGVRAEHYEMLAGALLRALRRYAGESWTTEMDTAWADAYEAIAQQMKFGADESAKTTPPWWNATVVTHEVRARDIAVITLRPDQPLRYKAGQYLSLESERWPRVWRYYSVANAPRSDNLITLHVRAVGAGWVSSALVYHTRVGDVVRIGAPMGGMVCNTASNREVLCLAGGTGLAPLKALIEDMARWNTNRRVRLYVGARHSEELYDMPALEALAANLPWLTIVPVVSEEPDYQGNHGLVSEQVVLEAPEFDNWSGHDAYVSGSAEMVRTTIERLTKLGMSLDRIRFDAYDDNDKVYESLNEAERERREREQEAAKELPAPAPPPAPPAVTSAPAPVAALPAGGGEGSGVFRSDYWAGRAAARQRAAEERDTASGGDLPVRRAFSSSARSNLRPASAPTPPTPGQSAHVTQASKSSDSSSERGSAWQASTKPTFFSSGSRA